MEDMEKGSGEAKDSIRLDQHKNTTSIQERVENERFSEWMIVDCRNRRQDQRNDDGQESGNRNNFSDLDLIFFPKQVSHRMKATRIVKGRLINRLWVGIEWRIREVVLKESGMSSGTLKIGPKMGSRLPKLGTNGYPRYGGGGEKCGHARGEHGTSDVRLG
ncbi:hypothetical protein Gorai_019492 [Gossypium raimondii]|uniref:Uncharacterized protein n=1 Tax=Gossypium raimondii TaxID=29730 RepID=A0A7J8PP69_GOSRA|nr:hypothetical protein [Gossypium raimondii]